MSLSFVVFCVQLWVPAASYQNVDVMSQKREVIRRLTTNINKVDYSVEATKKLITKSSDESHLAELYLRLAELYVERSKYTYQRLMEQQPEGQTTLPAQNALEVKISKQLAIETYTKILNDFPSYSRRAQVTFFRAHQHRELGEFEKMLSQYDGLIQSYPKSEWAIEARLILGDHYYDADDTEKAESYYFEILKLKESHLHDMARYRLGWIRIGQEKFSNALKLFYATVTSPQKTKRGAVGDAYGLDVKRDAYNAMAWPFSEVKKASAAVSYFRPLAKSKTMYLGVLKRLANRYYAKTEYQSTVIVTRELLRHSTNIEDNVEYIQQLYISLQGMSSRNRLRFADVKGDLAAIAKTISAHRSELGPTDTEKSKLSKDLEVRARDLATRLQADAKRQRSKRAFLQSADAYEHYLSVFGESEQADAMRENRALALEQAGLPVDAGLEYEAIARRIETNGPQRRSRIYDSMRSYYEAIKQDSDHRAKSPTAPPLWNRLEMVRAREGLRQLGAFYVRQWPKDKRVAEIKFNIARMTFEQGEYSEASALFADFVELYPRRKETETAGELAFESLLRIEDYDAMGTLAKRFADNKKVPGKLRKRATVLAEAAKKRKLEFTVIANAGEDFSERMLEEFEKQAGTKEGEDLLYTAFTKYKNEYNIDGVIDFGRRLISAYPESEALGDVLATMGNFSLRAADFEGAARYFAEFAERKPDAANALELLLSSSRIRLALGQSDESVIKSLQAIRSRGNLKQNREASRALMKLYFDADDDASLSKIATEVYRDDNRWVPGAFYLGWAVAKQGNDADAAGYLAHAAGLQTQAQDTSFSGHAAFQLARIYHRSFDRYVVGDGNSAESVLQDKLSVLEGAEQAYITAINSGDANFAVASLHEAARLYEDFALFIESLQAPEGLDAGQQKQYQAGLAQEAGAYRARSKETLLACAAQTQSLMVFSAYGRACLEQDLAEPVTISGRSRGASATGKTLEELRRKLTKSPEDLDVLLQLSANLMSQGDHAQALLVLLKATESRPDEPRLSNLLGVCQWTLGEASAAFNMLQTAANSGLSAGIANLGALYMSFGFADKAEEQKKKIEDTSALKFGEANLHPAVRRFIEGDSES